MLLVGISKPESLPVILNAVKDLVPVVPGRPEMTNAAL
jgi:hypothetical protein